jgi:hypothetical protein
VACDCFLIVMMLSSPLPFSANLSYGERKKLQGARSGEYVGCEMTVVPSLARNSGTSDWNELLWPDPHYVTCNDLQKELQVSLKLFLKVLAHIESILLLLITKQTRHEFCCNPLHVQILCQNALA